MRLSIRKLCLLIHEFQHCFRLCLLVTAVLLAGCDENLLNNPYPAEQQDKEILYSSFSERPKHLDPAVSYASNEYALIGQIYEPPIHYHYLKRPYQLEPLTAETVPQPQLVGANGELLPDDADASEVAFSRYRITIQKNIRYQPHPAFAVDDEGTPLYNNLDRQKPGDPQYVDLQEISSPADFPIQQSRELIAADYVNQIKRFARPDLHSPIAGFLGRYIVGLPELSTELANEYANHSGPIDLTNHSLTGAKIIDRYSYEITIHGHYPQFIYWLAMPFFAPMPMEVTRFYAQQALKQKNITLDWYPVGTGAYQLTENNPNRRMVLSQNPNYRGSTYPHQGAAGDATAGLLRDAGLTMPFIDKAIFSLDKESIPVWNKFLQGYYDRSGISSDSFDQAVQFGDGIEAQVSDDLSRKGISLQTSVATSTIYLGFNMLDETVGGYSGAQQKLRQAIAIAINMEEYISIFRNNRGISMHSPIPPGLFGYRQGRQGVNLSVYDWIDGRAKRKPLDQARLLLREAGYPGGRHQQSGDQLTLHFDTAASGPDAKAFLDWLRKQFSAIGIQLIVRATDYNRFQDKVRNGQVQLYMWGWNADYPDPENFLFLLYGPNSQVVDHGENSSNFQLAEYDHLFERMRHLPNGAQRQQLIDQMVALLHQQMPWAGGFHPQDYILQQSWISNLKPSHLSHDTLKYQRIDATRRAALQRQWNRPNWRPIQLLLLLLTVLLLPAIYLAWQREYRQPHGSGS